MFVIPHSDYSQLLLPTVIFDKPLFLLFIVSGIKFSDIDIRKKHASVYYSYSSLLFRGYYSIVLIIKTTAIANQRSSIISWRWFRLGKTDLISVNGPLTILHAGQLHMPVSATIDLTLMT